MQKEVNRKLSCLTLGNRKKGISGIVATILIVLIVVAAVAIIWKFIIPLAREIDSGKEEVELSIVTGEGYTVFDSETGLASVQIKRGNDEVELLGIDVLFSVNGSSVDYTILTDNVTAPGTTKLFRFNLTNYGEPESVDVFPIVDSGDLRVNIGVVSSLLITGNVAKSRGLKKGKVIAEGDSIIISNAEVLENFESAAAAAEEECIMGDANCDCVVDGLDLEIFIAHWGYMEGMTWGDADFDGDGDADLDDFVILRESFGRECETWEDSSFMVATWSDGDTLLGEGDLQADGSYGAWDSYRNGGYLGVDPDGEGGNTLRAEGLYGVHKHQRIVSKDLPTFDSWAGSIEVNFKDIVFNENLIQGWRLTPLAIVGGYRDATVDRNFVIQIENRTKSPDYPGKYTPAIYIAAYHGRNSGIIYRGKTFFIEDGWDGFEDRFVKIDWYFTPENTLFARVDNGNWESVPVYGTYVDPFVRLWAGWVSSYNGGAIKLRNFKLYGPEHVSDFAAEEAYCEDSDGGIFYGTFGETTASSEGVMSSDFCEGNLLNEYYCNGAEKKLIQVECVNGCSNGACIA